MADKPERTPRWIRITLASAAAYNVVWGVWAVAWPNALFDWVGMERPNYPQLWQCIGMIIGVYGIGYAIAAVDPCRHWPIVLVGFLGKVLGPIGMLWNVGTGRLPFAFGVTILTNDLLWLPPFAMTLWHIRRSKSAR